MTTLQSSLTWLGVVGSGVMAGVAFVFSAMVMPALARLDPIDGARTMQRINEEALRPPFFAPFVATALICAALLVIALVHRGEAGSDFLLAGSIAYLLGPVLVTGLGNVPLNESLARLDLSDPGLSAAWTHFFAAWMPWNHLRAVLGVLASGLLMGSLGR